MRSPCYASLDDALEFVAPYGMELKNGNSNHAPMVAEALCAGWSAWRRAFARRRRMA